MVCNLGWPLVPCVTNNNDGHGLPVLLPAPRTLGLQVSTACSTYSLYGRLCCIFSSIQIKIQHTVSCDSLASESFGSVFSCQVSSSAMTDLFCCVQRTLQDFKGLDFFWLFSSLPEFVLVNVSCSSENNVNLIELLSKWSIYVYTSFLNTAFLFFNTLNFSSSYTNW